jgi:hypothetical protein
MLKTAEYMPSPDFRAGAGVTQARTFEQVQEHAIPLATNSAQYVTTLARRWKIFLDPDTSTSLC